MFSVLLSKRLLLRGFIVSDFAAKQADFLRDVGEWVRTGRLKYREDIVDGLEKAPESFLGMLHGRNFGKMLVRMATPSIDETAGWWKAPAEPTPISPILSRQASKDLSKDDCRGR
jgi:hypothetical protein